jgi:hypothetical protein
MARAPGQFVGEGNDGWGDGVNSLSLGAWGGYIIYKANQSVTGVRIEGNAFLVLETVYAWNEPGTVWVLQDENGNGLPDDTWYELKGSHTLHPQTKRRYAVTYSGTAWKDNYGGRGTTGGYPASWPSSITFVGTNLAGMDVPANMVSGYVDIVGNPVFSIDNAIHVDGSPASLSYFDFVKVQTGEMNMNTSFGEISTEITSLPTGASGGSSNPDRLLSGADAGGGQYSYQFVNNSGYSLTVTLGADITFVLTAGSEQTKTISSSEAYFDYYGGNVNFTKATGKVTFSDA